MSPASPPSAATSDPSAPSRGRRLARRLVLAVLAAAALTCVWWGPAVLRPLAFFRVRHVEVRGTRYASPAEIARALEVDTLRSVWDDTDSLVQRVEQLPQVRDAEITRRLPGTLVVTVEENVAVAFVPTASGFQAYDEEGRRLAVDPSRTPVDLPIVSRRDTAIFRLLGEVRGSDPSLFSRISEVRRVGREELVMQLVTVAVRVMSDVTIDRLAQIAPVEEDLVRRRARVRELDLRFKDQVIARIQ